MLITPLQLVDEPLHLDETIAPGVLDYAPDIYQAGPLLVEGQADLFIEHRSSNSHVNEIGIAPLPMLFRARALLCRIASMRFRPRSCSVAALIVVGAILATSAHAAQKLKGFYSGSGGSSPKVHRVVLVEFAADRTAVFQQTWQGKEPQTWHAHWTQDSNKVTITFDPIKDKSTPEPLLLTMKHGTLIPTSWDPTALGPLGPPKLAPFGGENVQTNSVATCQSLNIHGPAQNCVTWDSRR